MKPTKSDSTIQPFNRSTIRFEIKLLGVPRYLVVAQRRGTRVADVWTNGGVIHGRDGKNHRLLFGENFLNFIEVLFAFSQVQRLHLRIHQAIHPRFPGRDGYFLARKPIVIISAGFKDIHKIVRIRASVRIIAQKDAIIIVGIVQFGDEGVEFNRLKNGVDADFLQVRNNEDGHLVSLVVLDICIENEFNLVAVGIGQKAVAVPFFNADFLQQLDGFCGIVRIRLYFRVIPILITLGQKSILRDTMPEFDGLDDIAAINGIGNGLAEFFITKPFQLDRVNVGFPGVGIYVRVLIEPEKSGYQA